MAFRKRNVGIQRSPADVTTGVSENVESAKTVVPGVRPSPLTGQPTTSTGTLTLDNLLGGHAGLPLGSLLLIEESGTTDFAGALLKFFAAEGITQGHAIHHVGVGNQWIKDLPGLAGVADLAAENKPSPGVKVDEEKMKIAWRYERLGLHDADRPGRVAPNRSPTSHAAKSATSIPEAFCHTFDLAKRLTLPSTASLNPISISPSPTSSPFAPILTSLSHALNTTPSTTIHRLILPLLLSPALYPPHASQPTHLLQFLHSLRALLRRFPTRLVAIATLPITLYPRSSATIRWAEHLSDSVIELTPFPHLMDATSDLPQSSGGVARGGTEERPQGMLKVHKLPVITERGGGGDAVSVAGEGGDLAFTLSRRKFVIKPFSLPPLEGDQEAQKGGEGAVVGARKEDIEF